MRTITLVRKRPDEREAEGTFGSILIVPMPVFYTAELPYRDNKPDISCLPPTVIIWKEDGSGHKKGDIKERLSDPYKCEWALSPRRGRNIYFIRENFEHRDAFQIHSGNYVGDVSKGFKADALGCILIGNHFIDSEGQRMIGDSKAALARFEAAMEHEPFMLEITQEA